MQSSKGRISAFLGYFCHVTLEESTDLLVPKYHPFKTPQLLLPPVALSSLVQLIFDARTAAFWRVEPVRG